MGEINIPSDEQKALAAIDAKELDRLINQAIRMEQIGDLRRPLVNCGAYIANQLHYFEQALKRHRDAKAPRKREETTNDLRRAASKLSYAVAAMTQRMETEQKDGELFFVDDKVVPPGRFSEHLSVCVNYRWRRMVDEQWMFGRITFTHDVNACPEYIQAPKRKPSAAKQGQDRQDRLYQIWQHFMRSALYSVRDYFRNGGDGANIPETFQATVDSYSRGLNNYSTQFWCQQPLKPAS
ncbi:MAG TPA: hypothetical protein VHZ26_02645 [Caulobacteraceae bacterium]|jgi:hypothetical protein|nr:hypothetical protein [Caulobacteraceae bacterium]